MFEEPLEKQCTVMYLCMAVLSLVHVTMVGGPLEELNERVKTGGSASREDMRANCMFVSTLGPSTCIHS